MIFREYIVSFNQLKSLNNKWYFIVKKKEIIT